MAVAVVGCASTKEKNSWNGTGHVDHDRFQGNASHSWNIANQPLISFALYGQQSGRGGRGIDKRGPNHLSWNRAAAGQADATVRRNGKGRTDSGDTRSAWASATLVMRGKSRLWRFQKLSNVCGGLGTRVNRAHRGVNGSGKLVKSIRDADSTLG